MEQSTYLRSVLEEIQTRLGQIDTELETLTGTDLDPLDGKGFTALVTKRGRLVQEREALVLRHDAVTQAKVGQGREEANGRITAIAAEASGVVAEAEEGRARFMEALGHLLSLVKAAGARRQRYHALMDEGRYLAAVHGLDCSSFPALSMPDEKEADTLAQLVKDMARASTTNEWQWKHDELRRRRLEERARQQPKPTLRVDARIESRDSVLARLWEEQAEERRRTVEWIYPSGQEDARVEVTGNLPHGRNPATRRRNTMRSLLIDQE